MEFVVNLRQQTIEAFDQQSILPAAFLLSAHRATPIAITRAQRLRSLGVSIYADNGTKELIEQVIEGFAEPAKAIALEARQVRRKLGRTARGASVPAQLRRQASDLAEAVVAECTRLSEAVDPTALLDTQFRMLPSHLFAQEDFAVASLIALQLEREITGWGIERFDQRNRRSLALHHRALQDPRCRGARVYAVLSAMDYNTARSAGRLAARAGVNHIAFGAASITLNATAVDFFTLGRASRQLAMPAPRRYVRLAQVVRGFVDGYRDAGRIPESLHALGLGNPFMFPILAAAAGSVPTLTLDATSPIHDAAKDEVLYDELADGDRIGRLEIVERIVKGGNWPLCPFCLGFSQQFGHDEAQAVAWFEEEGRPEITRVAVDSSAPLAAAIPLVASPGGSALARTASNTHILHNHFVVGQLSRAYPGPATRREVALAKLGDLLVHSPSASLTLGLRVAQEILVTSVS